MKGVLMVFLGGGLGSISRYLIYRLLENSSSGIPYGTLLVNIVGSLILGLILGYSLKNADISQNTILFLTTGFCGGFTTFSTFAFENQAYIRAGEYVNFTIYGLGSLLLGITAIMIGIFASRFI